MKLKRSRETRRGRIEIIPMIDVMFFLLATFMLASLALQRLDSFRIDLPSGQAAPLNGEQMLTLTIDQNNTVWVNREATPMPRVANTVHSKLKPDGKVVIAADAGAAHGVVVKAMLQARNGGARHFLIAVQHE